MRKLTRARFGAQIGGGHPRSHGFTPVATHLDRFAVRFGRCARESIEAGFGETRPTSVENVNDDSISG